MNTDFVKVHQLLETGADLVSPHLRWLMRKAIIAYCSDIAINIISYSKDLPKTEELDKDGKKKIVYGETYGPCRAVAINVLAHLKRCIKLSTDTENMYTSLRCLLIRELLDTGVHEAHHLLVCLKSGDFSNSTLEEKEATQAAWDQSWMAAKHWDVDIKTFGPLLDKALEKHFDELRTNMELDNAKPWEEIQLYMWDNDLAFWNPEKKQKCTMREAFESMVEDDHPWLDKPEEFLSDIGTLHSNLDAEEQADALTDVPITPQQEIILEDTEIVEDIPEDTVEVFGTVDEPPEPDYTLEEMIKAGWTHKTLLDSVDYAHLVPADVKDALLNPESVPAPPTEAPTPPAPPVEAPALSANALQIRKTIELVLRTLFVHTMTKCEATKDGRFNNAGAVLETINLANIPGALELITHYDTTDANGVYAGNQPSNGFIKGIVSKSTGYPMYRFYMKIGGELMRRSFIPQHPNKMKNHELAPWAVKARAGHKIMLFLEEGKGGKASMELAAGQPLGQEKFNIWADK